MATEKRLIEADALLACFEAEYKQSTYPYFHMDEIADEIIKAPTVNAVILPYRPRPMLKDRNPHNMDVYCPECGTNLSGYYGDEPLPIVTCFNCGEILDPCKATTGTDGERKYNG